MLNLDTNWDMRKLGQIWVKWDTESKTYSVVVRMLHDDLVFCFLLLCNSVVTSHDVFI